MVSLDRAWQTARILWGALTVSQVTFIGVLFAVRQPPRLPPQPVMLYAISAVAAIVAVVSFVLPARTVQAGLAARGLKGLARPRENETLTEEQQRKIFGLYQTALILSLALSESISLFGFVLGFLGFEPVAFGPFFAVGLLLSLSRFPTAAHMASMLPEQSL